MLTGNKFHKLNSNAEVVRVTTDDIPEGEYNKYCLNYADGKLIGDIIVRPSPEELACHSLLNGQLIHEYKNKDFYNMCLEYKNLSETDPYYENFSKTLEEYEEFYTNNTWQETGENYCPYYVVASEYFEVYEVEKYGLKGYTDLPGEADTEVASGYIYDDEYLSNTIDVSADWFYTGVVLQSTDNFVKLPTAPTTYIDGVTRGYYFIVTSSRVDDNTTSIRTVSVGKTFTLQTDEQAYVRNVGTIQNLVLDFGIPSGESGTLQIGEVVEGDFPSVENVGTPSEAILNFVIPRGEQGIAGGVVVLKEIVDELPSTSDNTEDKYYLITDNIIYTFNGTAWEQFDTANAGLIYLNNSNIYYYDGEKLVTTHSVPKIDELTISLNGEGAIENIATKTVQGSVVYDWVGTLKEWEQGRSDGTILDSYICFVTDD